MEEDYNMSKVELLDCTLRDGAYIVDKTFGDSVINGIIRGLSDAGIDYIETGFLQDEGFGEGKTVYKDSNDAGRFIPCELIGKRTFVALADCSRYTISNLDEKTSGGLDAIRECFFMHETQEAMDNCKMIKQKGYKVFVQPVDILGYSDKELLNLIGMVNEIEPFCFSIVDTFGSMYLDDLRRVFALVDHNLDKKIRLGFHSHNNLQLSSALSQELISLAEGKRDIIIDCTISGMGRGAGNTPTELITHYLIEKKDKKYNIDAILDIIDNHIDYLRTRSYWGYKTEFFVAGMFSAHVNNVQYLKAKNSIRSKDIRYILEKLGREKRKRYDYDLIEKIYSEMMSSDYDDSYSKKRLKDIIGKRVVLIIAPGRSVKEKREKIEKWIKDNEPYVIFVNHINENIESDAIFISNKKRYNLIRYNDRYLNYERIVTTNFSDEITDDDAIRVSFSNYLMPGWTLMDNSTIMCLNLLKSIGVKRVGIAGFDGYSPSGDNYMRSNMELESSSLNAKDINHDIAGMFSEFMKKRGDMEVFFVTNSIFENDGETL